MQIIRTQKEFVKISKIKKLGEYHDFYVQSDTLLLNYVFNNFQNMCIEIYGLDTADFLSVSGLTQQVVLKNTKVKLDLSTYINILLMVKKGVRGGISLAIYEYAKANDKFMKDYDKNKESLYLNNQNVNYLCGQAMPQKLSVGQFKRYENMSQFSKHFIENYNEDSDEGHFY